MILILWVCMLSAGLDDCKRNNSVSFCDGVGSKNCLVGSSAMLRLGCIEVRVLVHYLDGYSADLWVVKVAGSRRWSWFCSWFWSWWSLLPASSWNFVQLGPSMCTSGCCMRVCAGQRLFWLSTLLWLADLSIFCSTTKL